ncbi:restriction endonuclease subunit S [Tenacibaculum maritimum]|uniref:restriction endonuclease subunit S n=1 Tax=Tenacibaculum maritimum TaxID=107401 RepID=UPI00387788C7
MRGTKQSVSMEQQLKAYENYKDSGIHFLGEIPKEWKTARLKEITNPLTGFPFKSSEYSDKGIKLARGINVKEGVFNWKDTKYWSNLEPFLNKYFLKNGDILIQMDGSKVGKNFCKVKNEDLPILLLQRVTRLRVKKELSSDFLYYTLASKGFFYWVTITKTDPMVPHIAPKDINNYIIPFPPLKEQTQIANYLDAKTSTIDKKINLLQQKIKHYKTYRKMVINETVTKGLENDFSKWVSCRLKDIGYLYSGLSGKSGNDFNQDDNPNNRGFIPFTNIANNTYLDQNHLGTVVIEEKEKQNQVRKNDIFFLMSSEGYEDIGKSAVLIEDIEETYLNSFCKGFRITNKNCEASFINYLLFSDSYRQKMLVEGKGFTRINLKMEKVHNFSILIPPTKKEQQQIANYLDAKTTTIDKIVNNIEAQITMLKELRKTLINEVVTGKVKVTSTSLSHQKASNQPIV